MDPLSLDLPSSVFDKKAGPKRGHPEVLVPFISSDCFSTVLYESGQDVRWSRWVHDASRNTGDEAPKILSGVSDC